GRRLRLQRLGARTVDLPQAGRGDGVPAHRLDGAGQGDGIRFRPAAATRGRRRPDRLSPPPVLGGLADLGWSPPFPRLPLPRYLGVGSGPRHWGAAAERAVSIFGAPERDCAV